MRLKEIRNNLGISLSDAVIATGIPLRTYIRYEGDDNYGNALKRKAMIDLLIQNYQVTEDKGRINTDFIMKHVKNVLSKYDEHIKFCYLFGKYAKGIEQENSSIDLCIDSSLSKKEEDELVNDLKEVLIKRINLCHLSNAIKDGEMISEIMKEGIKIYG